MHGKQKKKNMLAKGELGATISHNGLANENNGKRLKGHEKRGEKAGVQVGVGRKKTKTALEPESHHPRKVVQSRNGTAKSHSQGKGNQDTVKDDHGIVGGGEWGHLNEQGTRSLRGCV